MRSERLTWSPRRSFGAAALFSAGLLVLWTVGSVIDLSDGQTWDQTKRRYSASLKAEGFEVNDFGFYKIDRGNHPREFKNIVVLRGVMPAIFFGTCFVVFTLGWSAQPKATVVTDGQS